MDLALTFHIGLCLRIPRNDRQSVSEFPIEPFAECARYLQEASDAVQHAEEVADYQAIGVRCREALLAFTNVAQAIVPWTSEDERPQKANFKAWVDHVCNVVLSGESQKERRKLFKSLLISVWDFANWLTHTKHRSGTTPKPLRTRPATRSRILYRRLFNTHAAYQRRARRVVRTACPPNAATILSMKANGNARLARSAIGPARPYGSNERPLWARKPIARRLKVIA